MGKGSGSSTTTSTSAPPPDVTAQYDNLIAQANAQSAQPLQQYQGSIVAPLNASQNQAATDVTNAQGLANPYYSQAQGLIQQGSQTLNPNTVTASDIQQYQNPYTQNVINSTLANMQQSQAGQQSQLAGNAASSGAFGGDRQAVAQALLANQQDLANNQTIAGLENQSYSQALGEANTQQQAQNASQQASQYLQQQGGFGLNQLGTQAENTALTGANALNQIGGQQQAETQSQLNVPYEQFLQQQAFPYQNLSWLSSLSTGLGSGEGGTSTTTQPAPNSLFGFNRGGHIEGLIKRLATGGAVMMPGHYDSGGIIPGQMNSLNQAGMSVPDISVSYIPGSTSLTRGVGIPNAPKEQQQPDAMSQLSQGVGVASGVKGLFGGSGKSPIGNPAGSFGLSGSNGLASSEAADTSSLGSAYGPVGEGASAAGTNGFLSSMGDAFMSLFKDGGAVSKGLIKHYDDGGGVTPFDMSTNPLANNKVSQYSQMPLSQLEQLSMRMPPNTPQGQIIQQVLKQKQMMPNAGQPSTSAPMAPSSPQGYAFGGNVLPDVLSAVGDVVGTFFGDPMAGNQFTSTLSNVDGGATKPGFQPGDIFKSRGGLIKKYADGGGDDDYLSQLNDNDVPTSATSSIPSDLPSTGLIKADPTLAHTVAQPVNITRDSDAPAAGLVKAPSAQTADSNGFTPIPLPSFHDDKPINDVSPWLSVLAGVAGAASGRSPYILQNLAGGVESGLTNYGQQKKEAADETYKSGAIQDARDQLVREAQQFNAKGQQDASQFQQNLTLDQQKADQQAKYQAAEIANQQAERKNQQLQLNKPEFDKAGNPWFRDASSPTGWTKATGNVLGADKNIYGYDIGSVPQGTNAPVIDPKFDPTLGMDVTRKSINAQKTQDQLEKDNAAAAVNNDSIARLQAAKNVITTAPTGGITNLFGVGPVADAFSTQRQELGALNKELAMAPGERPTNMRLTQGEVMMLKQAQPGNDKSAQANSDIADANIAIRTRPQEFANFKNDFVANNGYWNDAVGQQIYNQYVKDNPIIDVSKSGQGKIVLNPNRQTIEQYANNGGFAKYGVKGNPQANNQPSGNDQKPSAPLPMPTSKNDLRTNQVYQTAKGPATWDGSQFMPVSP